MSMFVCPDVFQVDKYLKEILQDVISNLTSNTWRVRESRYNNNTSNSKKLRLLRLLSIFHQFI